MQGVSHPVLKDVVLVGAGHSHVAVLRMFGMKPVPGVRFTLISREVHTPYSGMLPGLIAGNYSVDEAHIDTGPLTRFAGARLYQDEVVDLDLAGRRVICRGRPPVPYDLLSLNIGSTPNTADVPGASEHAIPVKPIDGFLSRFDALVARVLARKGRTRVALVGAGAGGVELLLSLERRLRREVTRAGLDAGGLSFVLISGAPEILPNFPAAFRARFRSIFAARGIGVFTGAAVTRVEAGRLLLDGHAPIEADEILWTTQAAPARWLAKSGLPLDQRGFLRVDDALRVVGHDDVFAAGDTIAFSGRDLPKSGVYAVRAGPVLADNIRRRLTGRPLRPFRPQREALYLVSTGERCAVGTRNGLVFAGAWVWRWKDWIDRRFMRKFNELPEMAKPPEAVSPVADQQALREISAIAMRCGGCGAKVGASVLSRALGRIEPAARADVVVGLDAPDDAALVDIGGERLSLQTVDYFRAIVDDPYMLGKIAANHSLGDVYAMGGEPQTALAIATVPYGLEAKVEADLSAMMAGANEVLREAGCALVGGHTSEGAELALGFAVNGLVSAEGGAAQGRAQAGRRAHPDQADRHRYVARRRHARQGKGPLGDGGDRAHDSIERAGGGHPASARRACRHRRDRVRSSRPPGRDGARLGRRRDDRDRSRAAARRRPRDRGPRHLLVAAAAERALAPCHPGARNGRDASGLPAAVRPANGWRTAGGGPARRGGALRRRAARGGLRRRRHHWFRDREQRRVRARHAGFDRSAARRGARWSTACRLRRSRLGGGCSRGNTTDSGFGLTCYSESRKEFIIPKV